MTYTSWTDSALIEDAKRFTNRSAWQKASKGYQTARKRGILAACCEHMGETLIKPNGYWTEARLKESALKFQTRFEWQTGEPPAYQAARKQKLLDVCCGHMVSAQNPSGYWTEERCLESARQFTGRIAWKHACNAAYIAARTKGWLPKCTEHMVRGKKPNGYWTLETLVEDARKYSTRGEWEKLSAAAYGKAAKLSLLDACCAHMDFLRTPCRYWTESLLEASAKKYVTRSEWQQSEPAAYQVARKLGTVDKHCEHMELIKNKNGHWTEERLCESASRFASRRDWYIGGRAAYVAAQRCGFLDRTTLPKNRRNQAQRAFADLVISWAPAGVTVKQEVRDLLEGQQRVDIVAYRDGKPFLALEYCGLHWHSEAAGKTQNYHADRRKALNAQGIRCIHVWEDIAQTKNLHDLIKAALGNYSEVLRASKCTVDEAVPDQEAKAFYTANHVLGKGPVRMKGRKDVGLRHDGRLVAVMTFMPAHDRHTGSGRYDWCLARFATLAGVRIQGGASRLFKRRPPGTGVSYVDHDQFDGGVYSALGFVLSEELKPDYTWVKGLKKMPKYRAQRKHLPKILGPLFRVEETEWQNMRRGGWSKLFNAGKSRYIFC